MNYTTKLTALGLSITPTIYLLFVHYNILETLLAFVMVTVVTMLPLKKWVIVTNAVTMLTVTTIVFAIGGTL